MLFTQLYGSAERFIYRNEITGYAVLSVKQPDGSSKIVVGNILDVKLGQTLDILGYWSTHPIHGDRFQIDSYTISIPKKIEEIERYLASQLIPGVGAVIAKRIVSSFGEKTIKIIETQKHRLCEVHGIGKSRAKLISKFWQKQKAVHDTMMFLQSHGIPLTRAWKIYNVFKDKTTSTVKNNPYFLINKVSGFGFKTVDDIALQMGMKNNSLKRIEAAIVHILKEEASRGNVFLPKPELEKKVQLLIQNDNICFDKSVDNLCKKKQIILSHVYNNSSLISANQSSLTKHPSIYLSELFKAENFVATQLDRLIHTPTQSKFRLDNPSFNLSGQPLSKEQMEASKTLLKSKVAVLTGGPGTGKTTLLKLIVKNFSDKNLRLALCAPTGRAAKRLEKSVGNRATTIHRLLEFMPRTKLFAKNKDNILELDAIIIDEASMINITLLAALLAAVTASSRILFVGDIDQLPSIGPGNVLRDLISIPQITTVRLKTIHRQATKSTIVEAAHDINKGLFQPRKLYSQKSSDFYVFLRDRPEQIISTIEELITTRIPRHFGFKAYDDIQVLSPMNRGPLGTKYLNERLRECINPNHINKDSTAFRLNDRVIQTRNNYDLGVYNGDIGKVVAFNETNNITVDFGDQKINYDQSSLHQLNLGYVISIHRSQGSEFPVVILPIHSQHFVMLQRNLLYTAITRGRNLVVIVGNEVAIKSAVLRTHSNKRHSNLVWRISN